MKGEVCLMCKKLQVWYKNSDSALCQDCYYQLKFENVQREKEQMKKEFEDAIRANDAKNLLLRSYCLSCDEKKRQMTPEEIEGFNKIADTLSEENMKWTKRILKKFHKEKISVGKRVKQNE